MKNRKKIALIGAFILLLLLAVLFIVGPYLIVGPPSPLFTAINYETEVHDIRVEVFDSGNDSVLDETYELTPLKRISHPKPFRFLVPPGIGDEDYTFKVTLEDGFTETYSTKVSTWTNVEIVVYGEEDQPISISEPRGH
ncbi:TPA: hypothetical protein HA351_15450 [Methanosarcinaceae archaeon]|nr:hypothetical protein [Methanosarcinaceae archaeon]